MRKKPKDGIDTYAIAWEEWGGKSLGPTCTVIIKGNRIKVIHNGRPDVSGKKGSVYAEGIILQHRKTGKWIIGKNENDKDAPQIGGCSDGPAIIDFKKKMFWSC